MSRAALKLTCLFWVAMAGVAAAQPTPDPTDPGMASLQNFSGGVTFGGTYFSISNVAGDGVGYQHGYTQFGLVAPYWITEDLVLAGNGRMTIGDSTTIGANLGGFLRYHNPTIDRIFGINGFFDLDESIHGNEYRQFSFGVESLGRFLDFRANGYAPTTDGDNFVSPTGIINPGNLIYFENRIGFLGTAQFEESLSGGDFEFGTPVSPQATWLRAYAGMYAYQSKAQEDPVGFRGRLEGWVSDDLSLGVQVTDDKQFGTNVNASVNFLFSGWKPTRWFPNFETRERMLSPVQRNWRISTGSYSQVTNVPAYNPRTNQPYFLTWVDNSNVGGGDGTFEDPYSFMPPVAPEADMVLVRQGISTPFTPVLGSIVLTDWQRLLGEGREHTFRAYANYGGTQIPTQTYNLPGFTNTGIYPFVSSPANIVTLTNHNEVSAFTLLNSGGAGITNTPFGSRDFDINYVNLSNNAGGGIALTQATGEGLIRQVNALNNAAGGIAVDSGFAPLFLAMHNVTSDSNPTGTQAFGISINADNGAILADLVNIRTNDNNAGIILAENFSSLTATLNNVRANGNDTFDGIRGIGVGGVLDLELANVIATGNFGRGVYVTGNNTDIRFEQTNLDARGNNNNNVEFALINSSTLFGGLQNIDVSNSGTGSGLVLSTASGSVIGSLLDPFLLSNVTSDTNALHGLNVQGATGGTQTLAVVASRFRQNTFDGFHFDLTGGSSLVGGVNASVFDDNGRSGVLGTVAGSSAVDLAMANVFARRSQADGMYITSATGSDVFVDLTDSQFINSGQNGLGGSSGIRIDAADSNVDLNLLRTLANNTPAYPAGFQDFGLQLNLTGATQFNGSAIDSNFSNNFVDGVSLVAADTTTATLSLLRSTSNASGRHGLAALAQTGTDVRIIATDSFFTGNGLSGAGNGMNLVSAAELTVGLDNTQVNNNNDQGVFGAALAGRLNFVALNGTTISNNGDDGVFLNNILGVINGTFTDTTINGNFGTGVSYNGLGGNLSRLSFVESTVDGNLGGGSGLLMQLSSGRLGLDALDTSFSGNTGRGVQGIFDNGALVQINTFENVTADRNQLEGLRLLVDNGSQLNANINDGSFSNNGLAGVFDGVNVFVNNGSLGVLCFDGTEVDDNTGDGFDFRVNNGSALAVALRSSVAFGPLTATGNGLQAVRFNTGVASVGVLMMDGPNVFSPNDTGGTPITYTATNAAQAAFEFSGDSSNNTAGSGLAVTMTNVGQAWIDIHDATLNDNFGNGVTLNLNNVTFATTALNVPFLQGTFTAQPFQIVDSDISGNGGFGVELNGVDITMLAQGNIARNTIDGNELDNVRVSLGSTAIGTNVENLSINDNTSINDSATGDGIRVLVTGANSELGLTISDNLLNNNDESGIDVEYQAGTGTSGNPVTISANTVSENSDNGILASFIGSTIGTLNITENVVSENVGHGVRVNLNGATPVTLINLAENTIVSNTSNGFLLDADGTAITTFSATENIVGLNTNNGLFLDLNNSNVTNVNINDNLIGLTTPGSGGPVFVDDSLPVIRAGFNGNALTRHDDVGSIQTAVGFDMNFFGTVFSDLFVNNNGNVTFNAALSTFTPFPIVTNGTPMIAPFFADVDTRVDGLPVTFGTGTIAGRQAFGVNWVNVDYFSGAHPGQHNSFQLVLIDRSDVAAGDFDFEFNYGQITWETGNASGGTNGLGGSSARVGYTNGSTQSLEFNGSGTPGSFLDTSPAATSLVQNSLNSVNLGRYIFASRNGAIGTPGGGPNGGDGVHIEQVNSNIANVNMDGNTISNNGGDAVDFNVVNSSNIGPVVFNDNIMQNNGGDGVRLITPTTDNNTLNFTFTDNNISENTANGINMEIANGEALALNMTGNTIGETGAGNGGMGLRLITSSANLADPSSFNAVIGDTAQDANTFTGNGDAGIGIIMSNNSSGTLVVENTVVTETVDTLLNATYNGVGIGVTMTNDAVLNGFRLGDQTVQNTSFSDNQSDGIQVVMNDNAAVLAQMQVLNVAANSNGDGGIAGNGMLLRMRNFSTIGDGVGGAVDLLVQDTDPAGVASFSENLGHGLRIERLDNTGLPEATIQGITFDDNTLDGISLLHSNGVFNDTPTAYNITQNIINENRDGIALDMLASARVIADITLNEISEQDNNGIRITMSQAAALGNPVGATGNFVTGGSASRIDGNTFTNNGDAATEAAINVQINAGDNVFNDAYANLQITGTLARQTMTGGQNGIVINNNSSYFNGAPPAGVVNQNTFLIQGTDIDNMVNNGISLINSGTNGLNKTGVFTIGGAGAGQNVTVSDFGGDGIAFGGASTNLTIQNTAVTHAVGTTGGDDGIVLQLFGNDTVVMQDVQSLRSGGDGIQITDNAVLNSVNIRQSQSNENGARGLNIFVEGTSSGIVGSVYNIGNIADTGADRNAFNSNGQQGIAYVQRETNGSVAVKGPEFGPFTGIGAFGTQDVQQFVADNGPITFRDNSQDLIVRMNVVNNDINSNGNALVADNTDGAVFGVGTNSRLVLDYSGNGRETPGVVGNLGDDFRMFTFVSTQVAQSTNNTPDNNPYQVGDGQDIIVADPTARIDLLFGGKPATNNTVPVAVTGNPYNYGEQIRIENGTGANVIAGVTNVTQLNADPFKGGARGFLTTARVWKTVNTDAPFFNLNNNIFIQNGVTQDIPSAFTGAGYTQQNGNFP